MSADKYLEDKPLSESKWFVPAVVALVVVMAGAFAFLLVNRVGATFSHRGWDYDWSDWGECRSEAQCGVGEGTQSRTRTRTCKIQLFGTTHCTLGEKQVVDTEYRSCEVELPACEPEVTPTPIPEPKLPEQPLTPAGAGPAPSCSDPKPAVLPWNFHVIRKGDTAELYWIPGDANTADILYRENHVSNWVHSLTIHPNIGRAVVRDLAPSESYTFALRERNACSDGTIITPVVVDPPAFGKLFPTNYWLVF